MPVFPDLQRMPIAVTEKYPHGKRSGSFVSPAFTFFDNFRRMYLLFRPIFIIIYHSVTPHGDKSVHWGIYLRGHGQRSALLHSPM